MTNPIPTWSERCETHPDHAGIVTRAMIAARKAEEIADLRSEVERLTGEAAVMRSLLRRCNAVLLTIEPEGAASRCASTGYGWRAMESATDCAGLGLAAQESNLPRHQPGPALPDT